MTVVKAIHAPLAAAPTARVNCLGTPFFSALHGGQIVPVHTAHVVTICTVFHLHLPVPLVDIRRGTGQDFNPLGRLIRNLIQHYLGLPQILFKIRGIWIQATKEKTFVVLEQRHAREVMRTVGVELYGILRCALVFDLEQTAVITECPAMERTGKGTPITFAAAAQSRATVCTGIIKGVRSLVLLGGSTMGLTANMGGEIIVDISNLALMGQIHPPALEQILHL